MNSVKPEGTSSQWYLDKWFTSDLQFHHLYPTAIKALASRHWTPLAVARKAADFLAAEKNVRVLDIGSGAGKFCLGAAYYKPDSFFFGIEQRKDLVADAETARKILDLPNVSFTHGNFTQLNLKQYDHFYFYNSFYENLVGTDKIDDTVTYSGELYNYYSNALFRQLEKMPSGTRVATFHSLENEMPPVFHVVGSDMEETLKYWIKE